MFLKIKNFHVNLINVLFCHCLALVVSQQTAAPSGAQSTRPHTATCYS